MKKSIALFLLLAMCVSLLTACGCKHEWEEATCSNPKTCKLCGETEGDSLGHSYLEATCDAPKTCRRCGKTRGEALEHEWAEATCTEPMTCTLCGATEGEALGHTWSDATCTEPAVCEICAETDGEPGEHDWTEATCQAPKTCEACGVTEGDPADHTGGESELADYDLVEATAVYDTPCVICGEIISSETFDLPQLHSDGYFLISAQDFVDRLYNILASETDLYCELYVNESMDDVITCDIVSTVGGNDYYAYAFFFDGEYALVEADSEENLYYNEIDAILDCVSADDVADASNTLLAMVMALDPSLDEDAATDVVLDLTENNTTTCNGLKYSLEVFDDAEAELLFTILVVG